MTIESGALELIHSLLLQEDLLCDAIRKNKRLKANKKAAELVEFHRGRIEVIKNEMKGYLNGVREGMHGRSIR